MNITISEVKNLLERINSGLDEAVDQITKLDDKMTVSTQRENEKKRDLREMRKA